MPLPAIRPATPDDIPTILAFIRGLAEYVGEPDAVQATEDQLHTALFASDAPIAHCLIADLDTIPVGFALFFFNFSTWLGKPGLYIEDLYVTPSARRSGIGKALLLHLADLATSRGCGRMEWSVVDDNMSAIAFYKSLGAIPQDDATIFRLDGDALHQYARAPQR